MIPKKENEFCHQVSLFLLPLSFPKPHDTCHSDHWFNSYSYFGKFVNVQPLLLVKALVVVDAAAAGAVMAAVFVINAYCGDTKC